MQKAIWNLSLAGKLSKLVIKDIMSEKKNYKFIMCYDGTRYKGWEHQPGIDMTIQGKMELHLREMVGEEVEVLGAGRTDAGVHAKGMVCNARFVTEKTPEEITDYLNQTLPDDICILETRIASDRFHARYNAVGKTYCYTCYAGIGKPVFNRRFVYTLDKHPDLEAMREAAALLVGQHDFKSFCGNKKMKKSTVRLVDSIEITERNGYINLTFHGTGFLQHMVRILTGTLLEVGMGDRDPKSMTNLIEACDRSKAGFTAPAQGLCLMKVDYD